MYTYDDCSSNYHSEFNKYPYPCSTTYVRLGDVLFQIKYDYLMQCLVAGADVIATILAIIALITVVAILIGAVTPVPITTAAFSHGAIAVVVAIVMRAIVATKARESRA